MSIITAVVDRIAVPVILPVFQIVLLPIAEGIHQCKSTAVRGIIDKAVPLTLPAHLVGELHHAALHMVLHSAQSVQEIIVADEQVLSSALALQQLSRKMIVKNLGILQIGVGRDPLDGRVAANQPEAVHPVLPHPPDQRVHHQILTCALHKGHLHDAFHPLAVDGVHGLLHMICRRSPAKIGCLRGEIGGRSVSPVIDLRRLPLDLLHRMPCRGRRDLGGIIQLDAGADGP